MLFSYPYSTSLIEEIKNKIDIVDLVSESVKLTKKGARYWGLCPFHQEKTPSFSVSREKQSFYCFGCHAHGSIYDFVMQLYNVDFKAAKEILATRAGVNSNITKEQRKSLIEAQKERERKKQAEQRLNEIVEAELTRLIEIEQWCYIFLNHVLSERCLDRPGPQWALSTLPLVEYYLDEFYKAHKKERLKIVLESRRWNPWN